MSNLDLKNTFYLIPVKPDDWNPLGVTSSILIRAYLLASGQLPKSLTNYPVWILQLSYGVKHLLHYLDDFFTAGSVDSPACSHNLHTMLKLSDKINAPIKSKTPPLCSLF